MSKITITLPEDLAEFVNFMTAREYANSGEYVRELIRKAKQEHEDASKHVVRPSRGKKSKLAIVEQESFGSWPSEPSGAIWKDFKKNAKAKGLFLTQTAIDGIGYELQKLALQGVGVDEALTIAMRKGWKTIDATYPFKKEQSSGEKQVCTNKFAFKPKKLWELGREQVTERNLAVKREMERLKASVPGLDDQKAYLIAAAEIDRNVS